MRSTPSRPRVQHAAIARPRPFRLAPARPHRSARVVAVVGLLVAAVVVTIGTSPPAVAAPPAAVDLGTLGAAGSSGAADIDGRIIVGTSATDDGGRHAFAYDLAGTPPTMQDLGTLGGTQSEAVAVSGTIVVGYSDLDAPGTPQHAFAYDLGATTPHMIDLGTLGGTVSRALAIDGSIVVGYAYLTDNVAAHAFAYDLAAPNPQMLDLGTLGGTNSTATAIDGHLVAGNANTEGDQADDAFAYDLAAPSPTMEDLGAFSVGWWSRAHDVDGQIVVGTAGYDDDIEHSHAFVYDRGAAAPHLRDLGTLPDHISSDAAAIDGDIVVGTSWVTDGLAERAFVFDLGAPSPTMVDLGTLGGRFSWASAVDGDLVVGTSTTFDFLGSYINHAFVYDLSSPTPTMVDLGTLGGTWTFGVAVDGGVVIGQGSIEQDLATHAVLWSLEPPPIRLVPGSASIVEGDAGSTTIDVPVRLSASSATTVTAAWTAAFVPGAPAGQADPLGDYVPVSGTVTFAPGQRKATVAITVTGDDQPESDEYVVVAFSNPVGAVMGGFWGLGFAVIEDDDQPEVLPREAGELEGDVGPRAIEVPVSLSSASDQVVTVPWTTLHVAGAPGAQADPSTDYTPASGTVTFAPGQTSATVTVVVTGDTTIEPWEYVLVSFHDPINAKMGGVWGLGAATILDDDP